MAWTEIRDRAPFVVVVALSTAWAVFVLAYLGRLGWDALMALSVVELSTLLAAVAAPLVGLWLVAAVLAQRRELTELRRRLAEMSAQSRHSLQQAEVQARAMLEMEAQLKRSLAADTRRLALQDLAVHAAAIAERLGVVKGDGLDIAWARFGSGDIGAFVQPVLAYAAQHPDLAERIGEAARRDAVMRAALAGYVRRYERLVATLADDKLALETLDEGPLGKGFVVFKAADRSAGAGA
jgi:hypothetical protein